MYNKNAYSDIVYRRLVRKNEKYAKTLNGSKQFSN